MSGLALKHALFAEPREAAPRSVCYTYLAHITDGHLTLTDPEGRIYIFGRPGFELAARMNVSNPNFYHRVATDGTLGFGESYMEGWWDVEDGKLMECIATFLMSDLHRHATINPLLKLWVLKQRSFNRATRAFSKRNVVSHYDAGNDLYELFLDENMTYSCGYQKDPSDTIKQMQNQKHELICRKLSLKTGERIVDLGCGFASMVIYAVTHYGVTGVGVTLSEEQLRWGERKIAKLGLSDRISLELNDYRDVTGTFDKVVSIGMIEHVYDEGYEYFMDKVASLLPQGGIALLHTIGSTERLGYHCDPWINKHIFPGGRIPRLEELAKAARQANLTIGHVENLKLHYAETFRHWNEKFRRNRDTIRALGPYDEVFLRRWDYYLQACEAAFRYGKLQLNQLLCSKGDRWTLPMRFDFG